MMNKLSTMMMNQYPWMIYQQSWRLDSLPLHQIVTQPCCAAKAMAVVLSSFYYSLSFLPVASFWSSSFYIVNLFAV